MPTRDGTPAIFQHAWRGDFGIAGGCLKCALYKNGRTPTGVLPGRLGSAIFDDFAQ